MHLKRKLPVWLHADMETLQNCMFNYVFHGKVCSADRREIQEKWLKIKNDMEVGLDYMDDAVAICSSKNVARRLETVLEGSIKVDNKVPIRSPKAH